MALCGAITTVAHYSTAEDGSLPVVDIALLLVRDRLSGRQFVLVII